MNIKQRREALGLNTGELAKLLKLMASKWRKEGFVEGTDRRRGCMATNRQSIAQWEKGICNPNEASAKLLEAVFKTYESVGQ